MILVIRTIYNNLATEKDFNILENHINQCGASTCKKIIRQYWKLDTDIEYLIEFTFSEESRLNIRKLYNMPNMQSEFIYTNKDIDPLIYGKNAYWSHLEFIED
ncbi:MAG: hypothetical protein KF820_03050 [Candidatus Paracaedibacteraceae bacterium]|nr:hypothetical protein [Candidatus Paracaedibacteraceae bacterium]